MNEALLDSPEQVNDAPYEAWMIELEGVGEQAGLSQRGRIRALSGRGG